MRHFAEFIIFNGFNTISFHTAAKAAVAGADEMPGPRRQRFLKNNTARTGFGKRLSAFRRAPLPGWRAALGEIVDLAISECLRPTSAHGGHSLCLYLALQVAIA